MYVYIYIHIYVYLTIYSCARDLAFVLTPRVHLPGTGTPLGDSSNFKDHFVDNPARESLPMFRACSSSSHFECHFVNNFGTESFANVRGLQQRLPLLLTLEGIL